MKTGHCFVFWLLLVRTLKTWLQEEDMAYQEPTSKKNGLAEGIIWTVVQPVLSLLIIQIIVLLFPVARAWVDEKNAAADTEALRRTAETDRISDLAIARAEAATVDAKTEVEAYRAALKTRSFFILKGLDKLSPEEAKEYSAIEALISKLETGVFGRPATSAPKAPPTGAAPVTSVPLAHSHKASASVPPSTAFLERRPASAAVTSSDVDKDTAREVLEIIEELHLDL